MAAPQTQAHIPEALEDLPRTPASSVKTLGWRGVMAAVRRTGGVLVTNHDKPEAVILSTEAYATLLDTVRDARRRDEAALEALRHRFDERLAALQADDAGDRLRAVMDAPAKLRGKVRAGATH